MSSSPDQSGLVLSTLNQDGSRRWLNPRLFKGAFWKKRLVVAWGLIAIFVFMPYVKIGGHPAVLLDISSGQFHLFGGTFYATDTMLLMLLLISVIVGIFFLTAVFGRIWCGWACPQTVYLEFVYRPLERFFAKLPAGLALLKYPVYLLISFLLAHVFLSYFVGVEELAKWMQRSPAEHPRSFLVVASVTAAMFFDFAFFREQTCLVACPYGRLQSVLLDRESLIVGYDAGRGEPRGKGAKRNAEQTGDCVDCSLCVKTCPTGIDIRDGLQMECIGCTQCIDACDSVMSRLKRPLGLIRYSSGNELAGKPRKLLRPRVVVYPLILLGALTTLAFLVGTKAEIDLTITRAAGSPYEVLPEGGIANRLKVRVTNRAPDAREIALELVDLPQSEILSAELPLKLAGNESRVVSIFVVAAPGSFQNGKQTMTLRAKSDVGATRDREYLLLGPYGEPR